MKKKFIPALCGIALAAVIAIAANVSTDYDKSADFGRYKTYSWIKAQAPNSLWSDRITNAVDGQLAAKGWTKVDSGGDAAVTALEFTKNEQTYQTFYNGLGGGWFWRGFGDMATTTVENTPVGTLVVDIFDANTKKLLWRGRATDTLSDKPDKNEKKLEKSVADMFKKFPPPAKG